jgi:hypothetical protein
MSRRVLPVALSRSDGRSFEPPFRAIAGVSDPSVTGGSLMEAFGFCAQALRGETYPSGTALTRPAKIASIAAPPTLGVPRVAHPATVLPQTRRENSPLTQAQPWRFRVTASIGLLRRPALEIRRFARDRAYDDQLRLRLAPISSLPYAVHGPCCGREPVFHTRGEVSQRLYNLRPMRELLRQRAYGHLLAALTTGVLAFYSNATAQQRHHSPLHNIPAAARSAQDGSLPPPGKLSITDGPASLKLTPAASNRATTSSVVDGSRQHVRCRTGSDGTCRSRERSARASYSCLFWRANYPRCAGSRICRTI